MYNTGIYKITNILNKDRYIGSASGKNGFYGRWSTHKSQLNKGNHHSLHLQNAWNKYGAENFVFEIVEIVSDLNEILKREQYYIDNLKPSYNICKTAGNTLGFKHSEETKIRYSFLRKGKFGGDKNPMFKTNSYNKWVEKYGVDEAEKLNNIKSKKLSISHKNKKHSNESKNKIKLSNSGEKSYMAKLNNSTAKEIRDLLLKDPTINFTKLGKKYDVGGWVIYGVIKNETYYNPDYNYTMFLNSKKLIGDKIREHYKNKKISCNKLSSIYNISQTQIQRIIKNKIYN